MFYSFADDQITDNVNVNIFLQTPILEKSSLDESSINDYSFYSCNCDDNSKNINIFCDKITDPNISVSKDDIFKSIDYKI